MTENRAQIVKVLVLPYTPTRILINRTQCSSSVFINTTEPRSDMGRWLTEDLVSGGMRVPLFNLDMFLQEYFGLQASEDAHLALIRTWDSFCPAVQQGCVTRGLEQGAPVAFRVTSSTIMADMQAPDFSLSPVSVQSYLCGKGIPAVSLPHDTGMQYLIDLDILFADCLLGGCNEHSAG